MSARIMQALMGRPSGRLQLGQAQKPSDRLLDRGYLDKAPPVTTTPHDLGPEQMNAYEAYMRPRIATLEAIGIPPLEARDLIKTMPDTLTERQRLEGEAQQDPRVQEEIRRLLERMR
jgi:hypothetical protein